MVDDQQDRHDFFRKSYRHVDNIVVQSYDYDNALMEIAATPTSFDLMFLDHDLSESSAFCDPDNTYEKTGTDIAKFIVREINPLDCVGMEIYCHSMNPWGRQNMVKILKNSGFNAIDAAFSVMKFDIP